MEPDEKGWAFVRRDPSVDRPAPLPLAPIYVLLEYGLWAHSTEPRDRTTDATDEEVSKWL